MSPRQIFHIARREYIARVRNKAFVFTTIMVPAFLGAYTLIVPRLFEQTGSKELVVTVVDRGSGLGDVLREWLSRIDQPVIRVSEVVVTSDSDEKVRAHYSDRVRNEAIDGYILLEKTAEGDPRALYFARETANLELAGRLGEAFRLAQLESLLEGTNVGVEQIRRVQRSGMDSVTVSAEGEATGGFTAAFVSTLVLGMLLYMAVLINGQGMALAIVEEKSSRLIEVILGAVTAWEFMSGKILGVLCSGLTQLGIWVGCALLASLYALPALALAAPPELDLRTLLDFRLLFYFSIFFALGYLLYSALFAAVAATCSTTDELGQAMFPAMFPLIMALFATFYAVPNPSANATMVLSLIPLFSPLVMLARINVLMPPWWEIWLSILLLVAASLCAFWLCGKIFRFALLMHGKRPSLIEIVRMMRAA